jgi:hypothetical protein
VAMAPSPPKFGLVANVEMVPDVSTFRITLLILSEM